MQSVKRTISKKISLIGLSSLVFFITVKAQDNSPYSRYGIGDLHSNTTVLNRGMGGVSAAYSDQLSVNFSNPASYSSLFSMLEGKSKKSAYSRILLDIGLNLDSRTLHETDNPEKFNVSNAFFSYLQMGIPLKKNWGFTFGLRPISSISYKVRRFERLKDPFTGLPIDSAVTDFTGEGGSFLVNTGTGYAIKKFSFGINAGYLFGKKDYSSKRLLINDSVEYNRSNHQTKTTFGNLFFSGGLQYRVNLNTAKTTYIQVGLFGNTKHTLNSRTDKIRETYFRVADGGEFRLDSVSEQLDIKGTIIYPASFGGGIIMERLADDKKGGLLVGIDFIHNGWDDYRENNLRDAVKNNWQLKIGTQFKPTTKNAQYKNFMAYRAGLILGTSYVQLNKKLPEFGISAGVSLPVANLKDAARRFRTQYTVVNISVEYLKRGTKENLLREDLFRLSAGFTLSDLWFTKRKYD